jgi:hypothetical protein
MAAALQVWDAATASEKARADTGVFRQEKECLHAESMQRRIKSTALVTMFT